MYTKHGWWFPDEDTHFCEMLDKNILKGGEPVYQEPVRARSLEFTQHNRVALDIGANIGLWSRDLCDHFSTVIAFEPVPQFRECLIKNVLTDRLSVRPWALGNQDTHIEMIVTQGNTGHSHVNKSTLGTGSIPMYKLDSLHFEHIDYVKIDCEGYELDILQGAEHTMKKHQPVVVVEQKLHKDVGITKDLQYSAVQLLEDWGAKKLAQVRNDVILGW